MNQKFTGQLTIFHIGDLCYYYRDGPGGIGPKLKWKGPARVVMVEQLDGGPHSTIYWILHGTSLLRTAPEHLRPVPRDEKNKTHDDDPFYRAQQALQDIRSRGTTQYTDLTKTNKRQRYEVSSDEEDEEFDQDEQQQEGEFDSYAGLADYWQVSDDKKTWTRVHNLARKELYAPTLSEQVPADRFRNERMTSIRRDPPHPERVRLRDDWRTIDAARSLHYRWTGTTACRIDDDVETASDDTFEQLVRDVDDQEEPPEPEGSAPPATGTASAAPAQASGSAEPPAHPTTGTGPTEETPEVTNEISPTTDGPARDTLFPDQAASIWTNKVRDYDKMATEDMNLQIDVDLQKVTDLPPGWHVGSGITTFLEKGPPDPQVKSAPVT